MQNSTHANGSHDLAAAGSPPGTRTRQPVAGVAPVQVVQSLPPVLKLDRNVNTESLIGTPGRVEVSGELAFASGEGGADAVDGNVFDGMDVVELLTNTLNKLGA